MKILLISRVPAYFQLKKHLTGPFPPFQLQSYWLKALKNLGHTTSVCITSRPLLVPVRWSAIASLTMEKFVPRLFGKYQLLKNRLFRLRMGNYFRTSKLIQNIKVNSYDAIIITGGISELLPSAFRLAQSRGIKTYLLHGEDPLISATSFEKANLKHIDWVVVNDPTHATGWEKLGARHSLALPYSGIDPEIYYDKKLPRNLDLVFVGTLLPDRQAVLKQLLEFSPVIYGYVPKTTRLDPELKPYYHGEAWGTAMIDVYHHAKIALNFSPPHMPVGGNVRLFEIPACGAMQITNHCPPEWFVAGKEIVLFHGVRQLKKQIAYYLAHAQNRENIAKSGHDRVHRQYTYTKRFKAILAL